MMELSVNNINAMPSDKLRYSIFRLDKKLGHIITPST